MKFKKQLHHQLIEQCKKNNAKAQIQLYNLYCKAMFSISFRYLKDKFLAEDVMQEGFLKAFKNIKNYEGKVAFGAWLKKIIIHQCIDELKRKKVDFISIEDHKDDQQSIEDDDWQIDVTVLAKQVIQIINSLPDKYRLVLTLYLLEGYDHKEIASILDITVVTSRTHLLRGKKMVLEQLKEARR